MHFWTDVKIILSWFKDIHRYDSSNQHVKLQEERRRKGDEEILPLLSPRERTQKRKMKGQRERPATAPAGTGFTPGVSPSKLHYDEDSGRIVYEV